MNICFDTFGCRLNRTETLDAEAKCLARGHRIVDSHSEADLIVVRGCSVTARAQSDCERTIARLRERYPNKRLMVTGCLPDAKRFDIAAVSRSKDVPKSAALPNRTARAYLKVQDGCSRRCAFCIVPKFRGNGVSVPHGEVLERARKFVAAGYHEIVVTGCNLALYSSEGRGLPELVCDIADISPECRVRVSSIEPGKCAEELLHAIAERENVCDFLHLSVQSASDRILAAMHRQYTADVVEALAAKATALVPFIGLGCDVIAGFPGESEQDWRLTRALLTRHPFSNVHAFPFSERPGTLAAAIQEGRVLPALRRERARALAAVGEENRRRFMKRFIGRKVEVVVERAEALAGWTAEYLWLERVASPFAPPISEPSRRRQKIAFKVRDAHAGVLYGEPMSRGR